MSVVQFKKELLEYIDMERLFIENDIANHCSMDDDKKVDYGLMIRDAIVVSEQASEDCYDLYAKNNHTRFRSGDRAILTGVNRNPIEVSIIDNDFSKISIFSKSKLVKGELCNIEVKEEYLLEPLKGIVENCVEGAPGYSFLSQLSKEKDVAPKGAFPLKYLPNPKVDITEEVAGCCEKICDSPSILCVQGVPGSGKTRALAIAANMISMQNCQVLIIALTHQAVNNALNHIRDINRDAPIIKIGNVSKVQKLRPSIEVFPSLRTYNNYLVTQTGKKNKKPPQGLIIGMTYHASLFNFGLQRYKWILPRFLFVDEASQLPMTFASVLGTYGASSICLFGDSHQMPPIFHSQLNDNQFSVSILEYATKLRGVPISILRTTYRMSRIITGLVSRKFYEPYGIKLRTVNNSQCSRDDIVWHDTRKLHNVGLQEKESNTMESYAIAKDIIALFNQGYSYKDIAVITPWRRQVVNLRAIIASEITTELPLIDTVERLQGQEVDVVILSFATTDINYFNTMRNFILNSNRLNVMISRAKSKVIIYSSEEIWTEICEYIES